MVGLGQQPWWYNHARSITGFTQYKAWAMLNKLNIWNIFSMRFKFIIYLKNLWVMMLIVTCKDNVYKLKQQVTLMSPLPCCTVTLPISPFTHSHTGARVARQCHASPYDSGEPGIETLMLWLVTNCSTSWATAVNKLSHWCFRPPNLHVVTALPLFSLLG